ncbi:hypothetical protein TYRP_001498 [Tyrophagus putrescentiae]|nr:hypothetical protein TYRP_001498 [Tyrophagus putrescentiae]
MSSYSKLIAFGALVLCAVYFLSEPAGGGGGGHSEVIRIVHQPRHWGGHGSGGHFRPSHWGSNIHWGGNSGGYGHNRNRNNRNGHRNQNHNGNNNNNRNAIINERINCTGNVVAVRHARCDRYYQCVNNQATLRLCPHGRRFDVDFLECLPASEANCTPIVVPSSTTQSPTSTTTVQSTTSPTTTTTSTTTTTTTRRSTDFHISTVVFVPTFFRLQNKYSCSTMSPMPRYN